MARFSFFIIIGLVLSSCQQQAPLQIRKGDVFHTNFPDEVLNLEHDRGQPVALTNPSASQGVRGATYTIDNSDDTYTNPYGHCDSIYGCQDNPWSSWIGYGNYVHSWYPSITRIVNMKFGRDYWWYGMDTPYEEETENSLLIDRQNSCWNLTVTSNRPLRVLRFNHGGQNYCPNPPYCPMYVTEENPESTSSMPFMPPGGVTGSGTTRLHMWANNVSYQGKLIFAVEDRWTKNCAWGQGQQQQQQQQPVNWWDYNDYIQPNCGGWYNQISLKITGRAGRCGAQKNVDIDLTQYVNNQWNQYYFMPYFHHQVDSQYSISGRVIEFGDQYNTNRWDWGGYGETEGYDPSNPYP